MATIIKTPNTITQTTGGTYVPFQNIDNLRNTTAKPYAITGVIQGKNQGTNNRPSTITCTNYQFNIPSNAIVRRVIFHYRHSRRGQHNGHPSADYDKRPNIKAPTIRVLNTNFSSQGQSPAINTNLTAKLQAPGAGTATHQTVTWDVAWGASIVNSPNFGVEINYPTNANNKVGYVLLGYAYFTIEYYTPNYAINAQSANPDKVYNKQDYHLQVSCSDSNQTANSPTLNITVPAGFNYKGPAGNPNGTITQVSAHTLTWTPYMDFFHNSQSVELLFETNVSFSSSTSSETFDFTVGIGNTTITATHTATIYKELPTVDTETDEEESKDIDDTTTTPTTRLLTVGDIFEYNLTLTDAEWQQIIDYNEWAHGDLEYCEILLYSDKLVVDVEDTWTSLQWYRTNLAQFDEATKTLTLTLKANTVGKTSLEVYNITSTPTIENLIRSWDFLIRPTEASLTVPNYSTLQLTEEELDRLGDGFTYTLESYLQIVTSETYVRDWYKNFRIGVFNNRIESNCTEYYQYNNTGEQFDGYLIVPGRYDITNAYITLSSDNNIDLKLNNTEYTITSTPTTIQLFELYNIPVIYTKDSNDNVVITLTLYDSEDTELYSMDYHINFNATEDTELTPITVDTTDYNNLTDTEIFYNAEYWSNGPTNVNTWENLTCEFTYEADYPLYILFTSDYPEGDQSNNNIKYLTPCIVESEDYKQRIPTGTYPTPIDDLVTNDGSNSEIALPSFTKSDTVVFYDLPLDEDYGTNTNMAIRGIELTGNIEQTDQLVLYSKLKSPQGESRERSILLNDYDVVLDSNKNFSIGGNGDLWGFNTLEMTNMEDWEAELTVSNMVQETDASINFGDVHLIFHIETVDQQDTKVYIEGEDVAYYGVFVKNVTVPEGLETDTDYLKVDGTDTNDAYRQNIKEKTIEIEFEIGDNCDLTEATESLRQFTKLLVNERDEYNRPIPKRLELSHYPDVYWEYIMEETLDTTLEISSYDCKAKLTIPAGTSYDKEVTTTSNTGYANGIANITPTIIVRPTGQLITITESVSNQKFSIGYTGGWEDKILELDCENRVVWLRENEEDFQPVNLNKYVDFNSDWFSIIGEYSFTSTGCVIRTVSLQERW